MNIQEAAKESGLSAKMIRHYEQIGLVPKARRSLANYRRYEANDVHLLRFVRRARGLGFSTADIKQLVGLWRNKSRPSAAVKRIAASHAGELKRKIGELQSMVAALDDLVFHCHGDERPECPILEDLATERT
jgi:MerR family transcriptional regulator, copper efflux regulator